MRTELIIFTRPYNAKIAVIDDPINDPTSYAARSSSGSSVKNGNNGSILDRVGKSPVIPSDSSPRDYFTTAANPNDPVTPVNPPISLAAAGPMGIRLDLYDNVSSNTSEDFNPVLKQ